MIFDGMGKRSGLWVYGIGARTLVNVDFRGSGRGVDDFTSSAVYASLARQNSAQCNS